MMDPWKRILPVLSCAVLSIALAASSWAQVLPLPARPSNARTGSQLRTALEPLTRDAREQVLYQEVLSGNVPRSEERRVG